MLHVWHPLYSWDTLLVTAEGFFTAAGGSDWADGYGCGTCAQLEYQGHTVTVNVVDRWEQEIWQWWRSHFPVQMRGLLPGMVWPRWSRLARPDWGGAAWKNTRGQVLVGHVSRGAGKWQHTGVREARKRSVGCQVPGKYIALQLLHLKNILNTLKCTYCTCPRATIKMKGHVAGVKVKTLIMWVLPSDDF